MEIIQSGNSDSEDSDTKNEQSDEYVMVVQEKPMPNQPQKRRKTMRFKGLVGKQELLIILDSGSAGTSISEATAKLFESQLQPCQELKFATTDGTPTISK